MFFIQIEKFKQLIFSKMSKIDELDYFFLDIDKNYSNNYLSFIHNPVYRV